MGGHIFSSRYSLIALNGSGLCTYSYLLPLMLNLTIPLKSVLSNYGFRISVGTGSIIASRKSGWPPAEQETVVVLI